MASDLITAERLRALLHYDPETGVFTWRQITTNRVKVGAKAGRNSSHGYIVIGVDGRSYGAHRLMWLYMTGEWPVAEIDHVNGDRSDNRLVNIRPASRPQNRWNCRRPKNNTSGFKGVWFDKRRNKWQAYINVYGRRRSLGMYKTAEEAHQVYVIEGALLHGPFARPA